MCNHTIRTEIRDATLANLSQTIDDDATLGAIEWASEETVDALALGTRDGVTVGDYYGGTAFRGSAL